MSGSHGRPTAAVAVVVVLSLKRPGSVVCALVRRIPELRVLQAVGALSEGRRGRRGPILVVLHRHPRLERLRSHEDVNKASSRMVAIQPVPGSNIGLACCCAYVMHTRSSTILCNAGQGSLSCGVGSDLQHGARGPVQHGIDPVISQCTCRIMPRRTVRRKLHRVYCVRKRGARWHLHADVVRLGKDELPFQLGRPLCVLRAQHVAGHKTACTDEKFVSLSWVCVEQTGSSVCLTLASTSIEASKARR